LHWTPVVLGEVTTYSLIQRDAPPASWSYTPGWKERVLLVWPRATTSKSELRGT